MIFPAPHAEALSRIPVREETVQLLGSKVRYWVYGREDAQQTLLLVHGYRGEHHGLEPVIAALGRQTRVISPDLPGFGLSDPMQDAPHSIAGYVHWLNEFVKQLELPESPVLFGHSFGSIVASHAVAEGFSTPALILVNPITTDPKLAAGRVTTTLIQAFYRFSELLPIRLAKLLLANWFVVQFMSVSLAKTGDRELRGWIHQEHHRYFNNFSDPRTAAEAFRASVSSDVCRVAERILVPTLLIAGEHDRIAPVSGQQRALNIFPHAELVVVPGTGHLAHYETPKVVADAVAKFCARILAGMR